jgi:hypothetical protein
MHHHSIIGRSSDLSIDDCRPSPVRKKSLNDVNIKKRKSNIDFFQFAKMKLTVLLSLAFVLVAFPAASPSSSGVKSVRRDVKKRSLTATNAVQEEEEEDGPNRYCRIWFDDDPNCRIWDCFSSVATVQVRHRGDVAMKDLQVGDQVLVNKNHYESVYAFGHRLEREREFLVIETDETKTQLEITEGHMLYRSDQKYPVRANQAKVGDFLEYHDGRKVQVTKIGTMKRKGYYAPLTPSGNLIVDGIKVSCYVSLQKETGEYLEYKGGISTGVTHHNLIHVALSPFRMFCMGVSSKMCQIYDEQGMPFYVSYGLRFASKADKLPFPLQVVLLLTLLLLFGVFQVMENVVGATWAPLFILLITGLSVLFQCRTRRQTSSK